MSIPRSYGRILWRNNILGFHMVNPHGDQFFIYAEPFITMGNSVGLPVRIKRKDKNPHRNIDHHPGEIFGSIHEITSGNKTAAKITLYFGAVEQLIQFDSEGAGLLNVIEEQEYYFPKNELINFHRSVEAMHDQHTRYTLLLANTDILSQPI